MATSKKTFAKPAKPHSLERMVKKIIADPEFGKFIHKHLVKAGKGHAASAATLRAHFKPSGAELKALKVTGPKFAVAMCTDPSGGGSGGSGNA